MSETATVFVVDDDPAVRDSLTLLLEEEHLAVEAFDSAQAFLTAYRPTLHSCAIVDIRMPRMDGLQLQEELSRQGILLPMIILTGHGDIGYCKRAIKAGALDFLTKPVAAAALLDSVRAALRESERLSAQAEQIRTAMTSINSLTEREQQVTALLVKGLSNKEIARSLNISHRTVEIHKSRIMQKTRAETLLDVVRITALGGLSP